MKNNQVHIVKSFISDEDCNVFIKFLDENYKDSLNNLRQKIEAPKSKEINIIINKILEKTKEVTNSPKLMIGDYVLSRYLPGFAIKNHVDTEINGEHFKQSMCLYLNNDFTGGEIIFSNLNIVHSPEKGDLVVFPSDYWHETNPVKAGIRYVLALWTTENKDKEHVSMSVG